MRINVKHSKKQVAALLIPGLIVFLLFTIYPIVKLFFMSFFQWGFDAVGSHPFCGLKNYHAVLQDHTFIISLENTLIYTVFTVPGQMILGLLVAVLVNSISKFSVVFRVLFYTPVITSWVIVSLVFRYIFNTEGLLNYFLFNIVHITSHNIAWLDSRAGAMAVMIILGIWKGIGWNMVIFLAALQSISKEQYESAEMDGAGPLAKFVYITLPEIRSTIMFALIVLTIGGFNTFTPVKMITGGKPMHQTEMVLTWMYYKAFGTGEYGYASALSFIIAMILVLLAIIQFKAMKGKNQG
ncbi:carbohydrate ABC transporter permease [Lachnospiraceae bacterium YH-ros2228]